MGCVLSNHIYENLRNEIIESKRLYQEKNIFKLDNNLNKSNIVIDNQINYKKIKK